MSELLLDAAGRRRSPATLPQFHAGRSPRNKGMRYPADPPTIEEIVAVMRRAGDGVHGRRLRGLIVVLWRAGLRICEALALTEADLDPAPRIAARPPRPRSSAPARCPEGALGTWLRTSGMLSPRCTAVFADAGVNHNPIRNAMLGFGATADRSVPRPLAACVPSFWAATTPPGHGVHPVQAGPAALMLHRDAAALDNALTLEQALTMATRAGPSWGDPGS